MRLRAVATGLMLAAMVFSAAVCVEGAPNASKREKEKKLQPNHEEDHSKDCRKVKLTASTSQGRCGQCNEEAQCEFCLSSGACVKRSDTTCPANKLFGEDQCASLGGKEGTDAAAAAVAAAGEGDEGDAGAKAGAGAAEDAAGAGATLKNLEDNN